MLLPPDAVQIPAYAKINLTLEITGRRDDGYHDIATILQTVSLADTVTISPAADLTVDCDRPELAGEANLVWRAATALAHYGGVIPRARIGIVKRIPVAAGLGGGSADAAAALRVLNRLWQLNLPPPELAALAADAVGMDAPFLLAGGCALATGRGDALEPLPAQLMATLLIITPAATIPDKTATLYAALADADFTDGRRSRAVFASNELTTAMLTTNRCHNAFTRAAREIFPGLAGVMDETAAVTMFPPRLSGAGPSLFVMPSYEAERKAVADALQDTGAATCLVRTVIPALRRPAASPCPHRVRTAG